VVSQPADNLVSKLSANPNATIGTVVEEMGLVQLAVRGLPLRILMVGTLTGLQWGIYDAFKVCPLFHYSCRDAFWYFLASVERAPPLLR
jgi:hypothetical protein